MTNTSGTLSIRLAAGLLLAACSTPVGAQQDVMRDAYGFFGSSLDVEVATESPGRIRLIRGQRSRIEVAGRAPDGFTSAALGGRGVRRLTLTALASGAVDFVISVPEDVRVRVLWNGSGRSELFGTLTETATYTWDTRVERPAFETLGSGSPRASVPATVTTETPRVVDITGAHRLDHLTVRTGETYFALSPAHRIEGRRSGDSLRFDAPDHGDIIIHVPAGDRMTLRLDGVDAIVIDGGDIRVLCESVMTQTLPDGRRWLTLTPVPVAGCRTHTPRRDPPRVTPAART